MATERPPRCRFALIALVLVGRAIGLAHGAEPAPPDKAVAIRTANPPVLDGRLDEPVWKEAPPQGDFFAFGGTGRVSDTAFRLAFDDAWLYVAVECRTENLRALQPKIKGHDKQASQDDSVEFFLDPGTEGGTYFHYMLSFAGARDERRVSAAGVETAWDMPWRAATAVRDDGWSGEFALPLCAVAAFEQPSAMTINVTRTRRVPVIDSQNVVVQESLESSSWAPVSKSFHEPERFLPVAGLPARMRPRAPLLARITKAQVRPYAFQAGRSGYGIDVDVTGYTAQSGDLRIVARDQPSLGQAQEESQPIRLEGSATRQMSITVPVASLCARAVSLRLEDPARGEVYETIMVEDMSALNTMSAYLDRNYYTTEPQAVAVCRIGLPPEAAAGFSLEARGPDGTVLAKLAPVARDSRLAIPLGSLPIGPTRLECILRGADGGPLFTAPLELIKREPKPGLEWKIDRERRVVLHDGTPFVPFGVIMSGVKASDTAAFDMLAAHNLNTFFTWAHTKPEEAILFHTQAASRGLFVIASPGESGGPVTLDGLSRFSGELRERVARVVDDGSSLGRLRGLISLPMPVADRNALYAECYEKNVGRYVQSIDGVKAAANLAGYFILDEPLPQNLLDECAIGRDFYARIHAADGYHPVVVNYSSYIPEGDQYVDWCDVLVTDPYWIPPAAVGTRTTPNHVSKITWMTDQRALARRQANWQILTGARWSRCRKRPLTPREIRAQTYLAVIHGATGVFYFAYPNIQPAGWTAIKELGAEMRTLTPFVAGPVVPHDVVCRRAVLGKPGDRPDFKETPFNPAKDEFPDVQAAILSDQSGGKLLLVSNSRHYPVACRFQIPGLQAATSACGGPTPATGRGEITDTLEPYATRAWRLELPPGDKPLALTIFQTVLADDLPNRETALPHEYRPGRKNFLPNPGFEDSTAEGWVDYCLLSKGCVIQEGNALHGRRCVRVENTGARNYEFLHLHCDPQEAKPATYTFSVWLKGSENGLRAWLRGNEMNRDKNGGENATVTLTTQWQRYSISGVVPPRVSEAFWEIRLNDRGTMWVDDAQLERSPAPTDYED
jgi:hypothetical protein